MTVAKELAGASRGGRASPAGPQPGGEQPGQPRPGGLSWSRVRQLGSRLGWGVADQGVSSLTNFVVNLYVARTLGAEQYGAFGLAWVTYAFALNLSRGLATDPLMVRFSYTDEPAWRRAVADCTGTAAVVGVATGLLVLAAAGVLGGHTRLAFLGLGLTLPGLMLQDSWRFSFFAHGRGVQAFLNDMIWAVVLVPALVLVNHSGHATVFWFVFAWGAAATVAALAGPFQARVVPRLLGARRWLIQQRDLGIRYAVEGVVNSSSTQLRNYGIGLILGLAAVGWVTAANTLMGPFMVILTGSGLIILPEATRVWRDRPHRMPAYCMLISGGTIVLGLLWGVVLLVALPRGLGHLLLGPVWKPTYPLVLPTALAILGFCGSTGPGTGLHALAAASRSLRASLISSALFVAFSLAGAAQGGALGAVRGTALATWVGAGVYWWQLRAALRESGRLANGQRSLLGGPPRQRGKHRGERRRS
jgi:O-antigen/teichoic acid export membrane protein